MGLSSSQYAPETDRFLRPRRHNKIDSLPPVWRSLRPPAGSVVGRTGRFGISTPPLSCLVKGKHLGAGSRGQGQRGVPGPARRPEATANPVGKGLHDPSTVRGQTAVPQRRRVESTKRTQLPYAERFRFDRSTVGPTRSDCASPRLLKLSGAATVFNGSNRSHSWQLTRKRSVDVHMDRGVSAACG